MLQTNRAHNQMIIKIVIASIGTLFATVMLLVSQNNEVFPLILIPLIYIFGFCVFGSIYKFVDTPGLMILNVLYLIRYYFLPLLSIVFYDDFYLAEIRPGAWLTLYEEIVAVAVFILLFRKSGLDALHGEVEMRVTISLRKLMISGATVTLAAIVMIILEPDVLNNYMWIFSFNEASVVASQTKEAGGSTLANILVDLSRLLIPICVGSLFIAKYHKTKKKLHYYLALFFTLALSVAMIKGTDRGTVLLQGIAALYFLYFAIPIRRNITRRISSIMFGVLVLYLLIVGMLMSFRIYGAYRSDNYLLDYLQAYVAGPKNMTIALQMKEQYGSALGLRTVFNDIFANTPFMSKLTDPMNSCVRFFNNAYGRIGADQVLPLMGNGIMYFGYVLSPVLSVGMLALLKKFEMKFRSTNNLLGLYFWSYSAAIVGFVHYQNVQLIMLYLTCRILPLALVYLFVSKFSLKREDEEELVYYA